jgi:CBS domain-containing protein
MKKCIDVMTKKPVACLPDDTASKAAQLMRSMDVGSIPVIESRQTNKLIGIVTDRDLALQVVADDRNAGSVKVGDVMTKELVTCRTEDNIQMAVEAMAQNQLRRIPVVDGDQMLAGIISQADVAMRVNQPDETGEMVREISQPTA